MATGAVTPSPLAGARGGVRLRGALHRRLAASPIYVERFKRKFASQVKNDDLRRTVLNSVVEFILEVIHRSLEDQLFIVESISQISRNLGAENIYIHVHKDNLPAWRLYDKIGFKMVDHQDGARHSSDLCLLSFSS
nr:unnamed protein product [Digitaria exilis]